MFKCRQKIKKKCSIKKKKKRRAICQYLKYKQNKPKPKISNCNIASDFSLFFLVLLCFLDINSYFISNKTWFWINF